MQRLFCFFILGTLLLLTACGGGGSITKDNTTSTPTPTPTPTPGIILTVTLVDENNNTITSISDEAPGIVQARLTQDGLAVSSALIRFETSLTGILGNDTGSATTNSEGLATIPLLPGSNFGAGEVTASYTQNNTETITANIGFESIGDQAPEFSLTLTLLNEANEQIRQVSQQTPGTLTATLLQDGQVAAFELIQFSTELTGVINPSIGSAITDINGKAQVTLLPGTMVGAGRAIATYNIGEEQTISTNYSFTSTGDAPVINDPNPFTLQLMLINGATNQPTTTINAANPGVVLATVVDAESQPVSNRVVNFSSSLGNFRPNIGTALTDSQGVATIQITAGTVEGAGEIMAIFASTETILGFFTQGDEIDPNLVEADINLQLLRCPENWDRETRDPNECTTTQNISAAEPGILFIQVFRRGSTVPLTSTLVSADATLGRISPETATAITNNQGIALLDLLAGGDVGAGQINITTIATTVSQAFEIGAANVSLSIDNGLTAGETLSAGATTVISVNILDSQGSTFLPPLEVEFTSSCSVSTPPLSVLDSRVTSIGGVARATYRADGCVGQDTITATVITGGDARSITTTVPVNESITGSIEFIEVSNNTLALRGTGGAGRTESSIVQFRVVDENGNPDPQEFIRFSLTTDVGGLTLDPTEAFSNNEGIVQTVVRSGSVPTPIRVLAIHEVADGDPDNANNRISTISDELTISTGLPDNNSFTLAATILNPEALSLNGNEVTMTLLAADHFNNPVPDGTVINLIAEGGAVEPTCQTTNGICTVLWRSQNPRPFTEERYANRIIDKCDPYFGSAAPCSQGIIENNGERDMPLGGRATILAYAVGEESFTDLNNNGLFNSSEFFQQFDLTEAFIDHNENGLYDGTPCLNSAANDPCDPINSDGGEFEEFIDFNNDGQFTGVNNQYDGLLCSEEAQGNNNCTFNMVHVRRNIELSMSGSQAFIRVLTPGDSVGGCQNRVAATSGALLLDLEPSDIQGFCDVRQIDISAYADINGADEGISAINFIALYSDLYNNPLPAGTTVAVSTSNGILSGQLGLAVPSTNSTIPNSIAFSIGREAEGNQNVQGNVTIIFTTPSGVESTFAVGVADDR